MIPHTLVLLLPFLAAPFWDAKEPAEWTGAELELLVTDSPWARDAGTRIYLASARPMREAERRLGIGSPPPPDPNAEVQDVFDNDYREFIEANPDSHIVLAIRVPRPEVKMTPAEAARMEKECVMKAGKKSYKMVGHFPATRADPYLRLLYPRNIDPAARSFGFELYLPAIDKPYRFVEFFLKEMTYKGRLEY